MQDCDPRLPLHPRGHGPWSILKVSQLSGGSDSGRPRPPTPTTQTANETANETPEKAASRALARVTRFIASAVQPRRHPSSNTRIRLCLKIAPRQSASHSPFPPEPALVPHARSSTRYLIYVHVSQPLNLCRVHHPFCRRLGIPTNR